ncbi:uncharacterized protein YdiU (UPF0061 family) [Metabacillus sp. SLBN-84]
MHKHMPATNLAHFTMLGDGRAILIGEHLTPDGRRIDMQLKGGGRTKFSRGGDGRSALGPMLREYIISEAMHGLGIQTTRSLAVVTTGDAVIRESFLPGAVLTRIASSHIRVGTFQYAANWGSIEDLKTLADYAIKRHDPEIEENEHAYLSFLKKVIDRQAELIAKWQLAGFIHGVMNTDNMTISGETIDYGPCAFMDAYDPGTVFSSIDVNGRYAYGNQPYIGGWNLARLAESLLPLLHEDEEKAVEIAQDTLSAYSDLYQQYWLNGMRAKLGLFTQEEEDESLVQEWLKLMQKHHADYTNSFRSLTTGSYGDSALFQSEEFGKWNRLWEERLSRQTQSKEESLQLMKNSNPAVIARNHRVEEALAAAAEGNYSVTERLLRVLENPYAYSPEQEEYCKLPLNDDQPYKTYCGT